MNDFHITIAGGSFLGWIYLTGLRSWFWKPLLPVSSADPQNWPSIDIIVPARDEAKSLPRSLPSLLNQNYPGAWRIILIDDHSEDGTGDIAQGLAVKANATQRLTVIKADELKAGWTGKVAAMQAGIAHSRADYVLFTDADIEHPPDSLKKLVARAVEQKLDLTSRMVHLRCVDFVEKLLIPAFVFFFMMLYPFRAANNPESSVAAAAGGVMLLRRKALDNIGGLVVIGSALIDDCSLARAIKDNGGDFASSGRIELMLTEDIKSLRAYPHIEDVWRMVARTAFTQLRYSTVILVGAVAGMSILFLAPILLPLIAGFWPASLALLAWVLMTLIYMPMVRFYRLPWFWALTLPLASIIYITATADSARLYWLGKGGQWKGRAQA